MIHNTKYKNTKYKILTISVIFLISFCFADSALTGWATGKFGTAMDFNGTSTHIDFDSAVYNGVKTISFWLKADDITERKIMDIDGTDQIELNSSSNIVATDFPGTVSIYIDGINKTSSPTIDTNWHHIVITDTTGVNASASLDIGAVDASYFDGKLDNIRFYNYVRTADEILLDYNAGFAARFGRSSAICTEDPAGCMDYGLADANDPKWVTPRDPSTSSGRQGTALSFDGTDDYVDCGNDASLNITDAITIAAWVNTNDISGEQKIVDKRGDWNSLNGYNLFIAGQGLDLEYGNGTDYRQSNRPMSYATGEWMHVAITLEGSTITFYKNGSALGTREGIPGIATNAYHLAIGRSLQRAGVRFNGTIDEVRIYNRALSAEEIRYHYNRGAPVIHYKFDEGSGTTSHDTAGNVDAEFPAAAGNQPEWTTP